MIGLGPLVFAAPFALIGLIVIPFLWWVLRATPPAPQQIIFAPLRLLQNLGPTPQTPETTPWWLILLRLVLAVLIVLALARPVFQPNPVDTSDAPLLLVIDDDWAAAQNWQQIQRDAQARLEAARSDGRSVALVFTATPQSAPLPQFTSASVALNQLNAHKPRPWRADRAATARKIEAFLGAQTTTPGTQTPPLDAQTTPLDTQNVWIGTGLKGLGDQDLSQTLSNYGPVTLLIPSRQQSLFALTSLTTNTDGFTARVKRLNTGDSQGITILAKASDGRALARTEAQFDSTQPQIDVSVRLPLELRNRIARVEVNAGGSAGLVYLTADRWRRLRVGVLDPDGGQEGQPLLSDTHYARQALGQSSEIITGDLSSILQADPAAIVLIDAARADQALLGPYLDNGGMVIRFAGPRMAAGADDLLPVQLRQGGRLLGGALAWDEPQALSAFADDSPFAGLAVPDEARVERQVLAEPSPDIGLKTWARLADGTPLVTAERRGKGVLVLFHITAGPDWSSLPLSGIFPAMLERTLALSQNSAQITPNSGAWQIETLLSGSGRLTTPNLVTQPIPAQDFEMARASAKTPPGIWSLGAASAALNAVNDNESLEPMSMNLPGAVVQTLGQVREVRLAGPLILCALIMFMADMIVTLALSGRLPRFNQNAGLTSLCVILIYPILSGPGLAQEDPQIAMHNALDVRLAYILTGDARTDNLSRAGLVGVSRESTRRSAVEPKEPVGLNIETDEIIYFPLIYWPVRRDAPALSETAAAKLSAYLQSGGLLVFDTRDGQSSTVGSNPNPGLVRILEAVNPPPLQQIPQDHVLGRTFYLLSEFPGRYPGGEVWVESAPEGSARDGVSGLVIGSADWASAWAVDDTGRALAPVEGGEYQRELAIRFGVNLAMYALTGNYKADQVHIPAILERLGRDQE